MKAKTKFEKQVAASNEILTAISQKAIEWGVKHLFKHPAFYKRLLKSADLLRVIDTEPASADISGWFSGYADTGTNAIAATNASFRVAARY